MNHITHPARFVVALGAAGALAGGAYVAEARPATPHYRQLGSPAPARRVLVSPTSLTAVTSTSFTTTQGYSRTSAATPLI